jgi:hypothetical protein
VSVSPWLAAWQHLRRGFDILGQQPGLYLKLVLLYSLPAMAAACVVLFGPPQSQALGYALPLITMVLAPVVLMRAVEAGQDGERIGVLEATRRGVPSVPRYVWTNCHTTLLFWVPVGSLVLLRDRSPLGSVLPTAVWITLIGAVALHQHVRTVLAPYLAIHGDLDGRRAAVASWHLGGRYFWLLLGTFLLATLPIAAPLGGAYLVAERFGPGHVSAALLAISWQLGWVAIQSMRPVLIPALHTVYEDLREHGVV